jgi:hypothetical protein
MITQKILRQYARRTLIRQFSSTIDVEFQSGGSKIDIDKKKGN